MAQEVHRLPESYAISTPKISARDFIVHLLMISVEPSSSLTELANAHKIHRPEYYLWSPLISFPNLGKVISASSNSRLPHWLEKSTPKFGG